MKELVTQLPEVTVPIAISAFGGLAKYVYKSNKGEPFNIWKLLANMFLAWFLGYIVQGFVPSESQMFGPLLAITWFSAYPILQWLETSGKDLITKFMK